MSDNNVNEICEDTNRVDPKVDEALKILENIRVRSPNEMYDFVSLFNPTSKLRLDDKRETFLNLYCKTFKTYSYGLAEVQGAYTHLIIDIDIKMKATNASMKHKEERASNDTVSFVDKRLYTNEQITDIVKIFQNYLKFILYDRSIKSCVEDTNEYFARQGNKHQNMNDCVIPDITAFILEKDHSYIYKGSIKSGFHIHFPHVILSVSQMKQIIFSELKSKVENIIPGCVCDDISDKPILVYGSRKSQDMEYYKLTKIFDQDQKPTPIDYYFNNIDKKYKEYVLKNRLSDDIEEYLPEFFSISVMGKKTCTIRPRIKPQPIYVRDEKKNKPTDYAFDYNFIDGEDEVRRLVDMLSSDRATEHDKWLEVGWVIYNISGGSERGFEIWVEFSQRTNRPGQFDLAVCAFEWSRMKLGNYTIRTLKYLASTDSPPRYEEYKKRQVIDKYISSMKSTDVDFADILHTMNGDTYKCASIEDDAWYIFFGHRWHKMDSAHDLRRKIDIELKPLYMNYSNDLRHKNDLINRYMNDKSCAQDDPTFDEFLGKEDDELMADYEHNEEMIKLASKIVVDLGSSGKRNAIIKECKFKFYDRFFYELLDENPYLLCFNNGIYDTKTLSFRAGRPIDYVSKCTNYDYEELNDDDFRIVEVDDFMRKLYTDPEVREWVWQNDASNLVGGNLNKVFVIHSGPRGNNGKSKKQTLIEYSFGDYCIHLPTSLITGKRTASSSATPELSRAPGTRIAFVQEPDSKDVFSVGIIKELTGNDKIYIRALFKEGMDVSLMFKLYMICNYLPSVNTSDPAFWNRVIIINYDSVFVPFHLCPKNPEDQFKQKTFPDNKDISLRLKELRSVYMWMLVKKYKEMLTGNIMKNVPQEIEKATRLYRESFDVISKFISAHYNVTKNTKIYVKIDDAFRIFKQYVDDNGFIRLNMTEFIHSISTKYKIIGDKIIGWATKNENVILDTDDIESESSLSKPEPDDCKKE